jgi:hypothetical protein
MSCACGSLMTTGDHWRPLATSGAGARYALMHYGTSGAPDSPPQDQGRAWMPSEKALGAYDRLGIWSMPPKGEHRWRRSSVQRTRSYMQVATTRQEHPIRLRRSEVEPGYLLCRLPGNVTAPEFGACPHTRRGQPHHASGARPTKRARQSLLRRHTRRDGVRGWRRGRCTWLGPVPIDTVYGREWLLNDRAKQ